MKPHDQVLKTLFDLDNHRGDFFNLKSSLEFAHPDLSQDDIADILARLQRMKLITTPAYKMKGSTRFIKVNPEAYIYFQDREARDAAEEAAKNDSLMEVEEWEDQSWNYKMLLIGFVAGLISGIAIMWLRYSFFG